MIGILHTTESMPGTFPGLLNWFWVYPDSAPHVLYDPWTEERYFYFLPHLPSKSLRNLPGGVETNNRPGGVYQVEIVGYAGDVWAYPDWWYANLARFLQEVGAIAGVEYRFWRDPTRFTFAEWSAPLEPIWYRHSNVPENDHWDPGTLDYDRLENFMLSPGDAQQIAAAVWAHQLPAINDDLVSTSQHPAGSILSWDHQEGKISRINGVKIQGGAPSTLDLTTVPSALLLAEVARRFQV